MTIKKIIKQYTCPDLYNCCDCGGNDCGCAYCFSCHACESCMSDDENAKCEHIVVDTSE